MAWYRVATAKFRKLIARDRSDREFDEEVQNHLSMLAERFVRLGMTPKEAHYAARQQFGNSTLLKETRNEMSAFVSFETLWQDIRFGVRTLTRSPGTTVAIILTLMLGIGANTAVFSVIYSVLLKPFPYRDPGRLVWIAEYDKYFKAEMVLSPDFLDWHRICRSFESMAAFSTENTMLTRDTETAEIRVVLTSESLGRLLGVTPFLGRDFVREELEPGPGAPLRVALVTYGLFQRHFGGNRSVLGKNVAINNEPCTIIGVLPRDFRLELPGNLRPQTETDAILNLPLDPAQERRGGAVQIVQVLGRLKPGVSIASARAELETIRGALAKQWPQRAQPELRMMPLYDRVVAGSRTALFVLWAAVCLVLLVACVNVANLLLAQATARGRETAIRIALGAGHVRLIRQLLTQSTILAFAGGVAGLLLAFCGVRLLVGSGPIDVPRLKDAALNGNVLVFSLAVCTFTGLLCGIAPALSGSSKNLIETLQEGSRTASTPRATQSLHSLLVVCELSLALVLLTGAGLMLKSLWIMRSATAVFAPDHVLTAKVELLDPRFARPTEKNRFFTDLNRAIAFLPSVRAAAAWSYDGQGNTRVSGAPAPLPGNDLAQYIRVTPQYFAAVGVRLLAGRLFGEEDQDGARRAAIVNEALVRRFFPAFPKSAPVVGRQINIPGPTDESPMISATIVGVVSDFRSRPDTDPEPQVFLPHLQNPFEASANLMVRASSDPMALANAIRQIAGRTPRVSVIGAETLQERLSATIAPRRFQAALLATFAGVALLLAMVGSYGVLSYSITQRTHEIGVRMALGARHRDVLTLVLARVAKLAAAGMAVGLLAAVILTRLMSSLLYGVQPTDPWTFVAVSCLLVTVMIVAAYLPARRAVRVDPILALRYE